ncbi:MAG: CopG family ribbon-helix-helix protein [Deltaproteobacteria bacterium]
MAESRKIIISLPTSLLKEVDTIASLENMNRSEFVRQAMKLYIREKKRIEKIETAKKGYREMAEINLKLAEMCIEADNQIQKKYENRLAECE